ncbi:MAG: hypothetical protein M0D55_07590 [Elusimicrobiota bacterium]|nr:MAG: hypothetical protein M0D55_07590 [Elusimicrobiota bacterium]
MFHQFGAGGGNELRQTGAGRDGGVVLGGLPPGVLPEPGGPVRGGCWPPLPGAALAAAGFLPLAARAGRTAGAGRAVLLAAADGVLVGAAGAGRALDETELGAARGRDVGDRVAQDAAFLGRPGADVRAGDGAAPDEAGVEVRNDRGGLEALRGGRELGFLGLDRDRRPDGRDDGERADRLGDDRVAEVRAFREKLLLERRADGVGHVREDEAAEGGLAAELLRRELRGLGPQGRAGVGGADLGPRGDRGQGEDESGGGVHDSHGVSRGQTSKRSFSHLMIQPYIVC